MAEIRQALLAISIAGVLSGAAAAWHQQRFFADDPIQAMPPPLSVGQVAHSSSHEAYDFVLQSTSTQQLPPTPAGAINTLGDVPDSEWFTNRHGHRRMSRAELQQTDNADAVPAGPFTVINGKTDGIQLGFQMRDVKGRRYFVKCDPVDYPELSTAAEAIVSRFMYAIGYNTPKNEIVDLKLSDLRLSDQARIKTKNGHSRRMVMADIEEFVKQTATRPDGSFRVIASLAIEGESIGSFRYEGTRADDPNDITPHENRRDLRGLYLFAAWLNNTDVKTGNTLDTVVQENGRRFIRHYLLDFGSSLGSDGDAPKDARFGNEFMVSPPAQSVKQVLTLGVASKKWERVDFPTLTGIGNFESQLFDPDRWKSNYPNPAFLRRLPDDDYWGAKQIMAFTDDDIRAIVETAKFSSRPSTDYMIATLAARRNKIGRAAFSRVLPVDAFRVENGVLLFEDLAVRYGFVPSRNFRFQWSRFSNSDQVHSAIPDAESAQLPGEAVTASVNTYFCVVIDEPSNPAQSARVYLRKEEAGYKVVGIDRTW
jgi:hypothetical protein